jgi:hypothetical protein
MRDNFEKMLVSRVGLPPVIVVNGDVGGPVVIEIKICPTDGNARTGIEKEGGVRKRGPSS